MSRRARYVTLSFVCGTTAILFETKLCDLCRDDPIFRLLQNNAYVLEDRPVPGQPAMLAWVSFECDENLTTMPATKLPPWLRGIRKFIPLSVTRTKSGQAGVNCYLNERFNDQLVRKAYKNYTITPLVCMSASTLERSVCSMKKMAFSKYSKTALQPIRSLNSRSSGQEDTSPKARRDACMPIWKQCEARRGHGGFRDVRLRLGCCVTVENRRNKDVSLARATIQTA